MLTDPQSIFESFSTLKVDARSDTDVIAWFEKNKNLLPNVPEELIPFITEVELDANNTHNALELEGQYIERKLRICYHARKSEVRKPFVTGKSLESILQNKIASVSNSQQPQQMFGAIQLHLKATEWPYVASSAMFDFLRQPDLKGQAYESRIKEAWETMFPHITLNLLDKLQTSGLLPDTLDEFVSWSCNNINNKYAEHTSPLPTTLQP